METKGSLVVACELGDAHSTETLDIGFLVMFDLLCLWTFVIVA